MMWDDDEGYWTHTLVFEPSGAVFSRRCPICGRWLSSETFDVRQNWLTENVKAKAKCAKCGDIKPVWLCWKDEYEAER